MLCLGVESSCDDTALALVRDGQLIAQTCSSQIDLHAVFGGVVPEIASRAHLKFLPSLWNELLAKANLSEDAIEGLAVTRGPGLLGSLLVGLSFAKGLALRQEIPLVGVNHLHAHMLASGLEQELLFPALGLLISGGHTQLYQIRSFFDFDLLGRTLDDAVGEAFDKAGKMLNLPYPGGIFIDKLAAHGQADHFLLPRPYLANTNLDFSFSGLKTAVLQYVKQHPKLILPVMPAMRDFTPSPGPLADFCATLNWTIAQTLRVKTERAIAGYPEYKSLIVAGGAACNSRIRQVMAGLAADSGLKITFPSPPLCTDNAAMIAFLGEKLLRAGFRHGLDLDATPRGKAIPDDYQQVASC